MKSLIGLPKSGAQTEHVERTLHPRGLLTIAISRSKVQQRFEMFALIASAAMLVFATIATIGDAPRLFDPYKIPAAQKRHFPGDISQKMPILLRRY
jgi:hypothetical protein